MSEICAKYSAIQKTQFKLFLFPNLVAAVLLMCLIPILFGIKNLDALASSFVLERFVSLIGIILITPVFLPEGDRNIAELVESKYTSVFVVYLMRLLPAVAAVFVIIGVFAKIMLLMDCVFDASMYTVGTFASAFILGAMGFTAYALTDNVVIGYMLPVGYFAINISSAPGELGNFYLFSLAYGSFEEKYWLMTTGASFIAIGFLFKWVMKRLR